MTALPARRPRKEPEAPHQASEPKRRGLAVIFPGQGAQQPGMGERIASISQAARSVFNQADEIAGSKISNLCFKGSDEELRDTLNTQPAILTTSLAYVAYVRERLVEKGRQLRPSFMAGHSLGQFTAAIAANSVDFGDGLRLVLERGRIMADWARARPGGIATVLGLNDNDVREVCADASPDGKVGVAVVNASDHTVISGEAGALQRAMALAKERGARVLRLPISVPGHSPLMEDAAREFSRFVAKVRISDPDPPLVSNLTGRLLKTADQVKEELDDQTCTPVNWVSCVDTMIRGGATSFLHAGPGHALSRLVRRVSDGAEVMDVEECSEEEMLRFVDATSDAPPIIELVSKDRERAGTSSR